METTTTEHPETATPPAAQPAIAPLPAGERDLRWRSLQSRAPRFRIALLAVALVLSVAGLFLVAHFASHQSTADS